MFPLAIFIGGPTASLKTDLAFSIQANLPSFIVNADSMQVYENFKILTNRPELNLTKKYDCHLFGFMSYPKKCNVGYWYERSLSILKKKKIPIFVGGTGLYIDSLINSISPIPKVSMQIKKELEGFYEKFGLKFLYSKLEKVDKDYSQIISHNDKQRIIRGLEVKISTGKSILKWHKEKKKKLFKKFLYVVVKSEREVLYSRINKRCEEMVKLGALNEVKEFIKIKKNINHPLHKTIGLSTLEKQINGLHSIEDALFLLKRDTRRYAKRQLTWFNNKANNANHLAFSEAKDYILNNTKL